MKKYLFTIVLFWIAGLAQAQSVDDIFNEFKDEQSAEYVTLSPSMLMDQLSANEGGAEVTNKVKPLVSSITTMKVLSLENCSSDAKERFSKRINNLNTKGYETLVRVNDSGEKVRILVKQKKSHISELLVICVDKDDCVLIQMNGKIKKQDIDQLIGQQINSKG